MKISTFCLSPGLHGGFGKLGVGKLLSFVAMMLLMAVLGPLSAVAQSADDYDASVTFTLRNSPSYTSYKERPALIFDGNTSTKWCTNFNSSVKSVIFEASKKGIAVGYTITTANDNKEFPGRNPKSWKLYGNNEGVSGSWTLIQEVTNDTRLPDENFVAVDYTCTSYGMYKYFRWDITAVGANGDGVLQVSEFNLKLVTCVHEDESGKSTLVAQRTVAATCMRPAYTVYKCSQCNKTIEEESGELASHKLKRHAAKPSTCTEDGTIEYWQCSVCNKMFSNSSATKEVTDIVDKAKGHSYNENFVCIRCGEEDPRYAFVNICDGVRIKAITDTEGSPWKVEDLSEGGWADFLGCPAGTKGLVSQGEPSRTDIHLEVDKAYNMTFNYASDKRSAGYFFVYLDDARILSFDSKEIKECTLLMPAGSHKVSLYKKYQNSPTAVYNLRFSPASTTDVLYGVRYDASTYTATFRKFELDEPDWFLLRDEAAVHSFIYGKRARNAVFEESFKGFVPTTLRQFFDACDCLNKITGLGNINTSKVTDMSQMFSDCYCLNDFDIENLNTSGVTNMAGMFSNTGIVTIDLSNFDTRKVTSMAGMFERCNNLQSINWGENFNTSEVTSMSEMFSEDISLKSLDLTSFDTRKVSDMTRMFYLYKKGYDNKLEHIYVSDLFATDNVTQSEDMFYRCNNLHNYNSSYSNKTKAHYGEGGYFETYYTKGGVQTILGDGNLSVESLALGDGEDFVVHAPFTAATASYSRTMNSAWGTLCLPFDVSLDGQNFRAFRLLSASDDVVQLEELETGIAAGTPVIIKMNEGETRLQFAVQNQTIAPRPLEGSSADGGNCRLVGLYATKMFSRDTDNDCYIVKGGKLMNPARILAESSTQAVGSRGFRAYMQDTAQPQAAPMMYSLSIGSEVTAIGRLEAGADGKAEYYDLQGRRLDGPQKGINILKRGGKAIKVVVK